jgi:4-oxalocrotonate tautomerase
LSRSVRRARNIHAVEGGILPYVNIQITKEGATAKQKAKIIKGVTDILVSVLNKDPNGTFVVIDEVELDNWGVGGVPVKKYRKRKAAAFKGK